jgi:hypothetical protein
MKYDDDNNNNNDIIISVTRRAEVPAIIGTAESVPKKLEIFFTKYISVAHCVTEWQKLDILGTAHLLTNAEYSVEL